MLCFLQEEHEDGLALFSPLFGSGLTKQQQVHPSGRTNSLTLAKSLTDKLHNSKKVWIRFTATNLPFQLWSNLFKT